MPNEWLGKTNESFFIVWIFWNRFFVQSLLLSIEIGFVYAFALLVMYRSKCFDCILIFAILLVFPSYWMFPFEPQTIIFVTFLIFFSLLQFDINQSANKRTIMLNSSNSNRTENLICKWISCFFFFSFHPHWLWPKHSCFYNNCLHLANVVVENRFNLIWKFFSKMYFDVEWPNLRFSEYWTIIPIVLNRNEHKDVGNERAKSIKITDGKTDSAGLFKLLFFFLKYAKIPIKMDIGTIFTNNYESHQQRTLHSNPIDIYSIPIFIIIKLSHDTFSIWIFHSTCFPIFFLFFVLFILCGYCV